MEPDACHSLALSHAAWLCMLHGAKRRYAYGSTKQLPFAGSNGKTIISAGRVGVRSQADLFDLDKHFINLRSCCISEHRESSMKIKLEESMASFESQL